MEVAKRKIVGNVVVPVLAGLIYWNTLHADFAYDDNRAILDNQDLRPDTPISQLFYNDFWGTKLSSPNSHKSFRPFCVLTFRINYLIHGLNPAGYHAVNVMMHVVNSALFVVLSRKMSGGNSLLANLAGLCFALHPIHTEAVAGIVGRADLGACLFFILSLLAYSEYCRLRDNNTENRSMDSNTSMKFLLLIATCLAATISFLFKETGISVLGVCILYDLVILQGLNNLHELTSLTHKSFNKHLEGIALLTGFMGVVMAIRLSIMGNKPPSFASSDNPAADSPEFSTRLMTFFYLPILNFKMLIYPWILSYDWSMDAIPLINKYSDKRNIISILFYLGLFFVIRKNLKTKSQNEISAEKSTNLFLPLILIIIPFLPASNLFFYVGFVLAERILYLPSLGFCWIIAVGLIKIGNFLQNSLEKKVLTGGVFVLFLLAFAGRTWRRNMDWKTEEDLYLSGVSINPSKSWSNLGNIWTQRGKLQLAEIAYKTALKHRPNMADAHYNLGILLQDQRRHNESIASYRNAINFRHNMAAAYLNLGIALQSIGQQRQAEKEYRSCSQLDISNLKDPKPHETAKITCLFNLGRLLADEQHYQAAINLFTEAINKMPSYYAPQSLYNLLGEAYFHNNQTEMAEYWYKMALQAKPDHLPAHLTYARFLYKQNRTSAAEQIFNAILQVAPNDSAVFHFYGQYLMDTGRAVEGVQVMLKGAEMHPNDFQSLTNAANVLRQRGDNSGAEYLYRRAAQTDPFQVSAHINLGAILHINGQFHEAETSYSRALQLDPLNKIALENLLKLYKLKQRRL